MQRWSKFQEAFLQSLREGKGVYANAYLVRISESLADDFPTFLETLNEVQWEELTRTFTDSFPSDSWTLAELSVRFLAFIEEQAVWTQEQIQKARQDLARVKSDLLIRKPASFDLSRIAQSELILNPTLIPTGNANEWMRETVRGTEPVTLSSEYSQLLTLLLKVTPLTVDTILEKQALFSLSSLEQLFHDWVKDEIFIGSRILKENL